MRKDNKNLTILQTAAPGYRERFFDCLYSALNNNFCLFAGDEYFEESVKTNLDKPYLKRIKNVFLFKRKLLLQLNFRREVLSSRFLVLELNPRILTNWLFLLLRKFLKGKRTILWGHAWPRSGRYSKHDIFRNIMRSLSDEIIVYTKTQADELKEKMPNKKIKYASNALYYEHEMGVDKSIMDPKHLIYVGRLVKRKKTMLLIEAFNLIKDKLPLDTKLLIVGDGPEREKLENYIMENNLSNKVVLLGYMNDYFSLKKLYHRSVVSVSPGYVGLSIIQSFSFGVPMLISRDEPHSPEIEAAIEGFNALFFNTDDVKDLSEKILEFFNTCYWSSLEKRMEICEFCKKNYSIERMVEPFLELV